MKEKIGITKLEIIVIAFLLSIFALFASPYFLTTKEQRQEATIRANVDVAVSAITSRFALKTPANAMKVAMVSANFLNQTNKNPVLGRGSAFSISIKSVAPGRVVFFPNNEEHLIEIKGYGKDTAEPLLTKVVRGYK